MKSVLFDSEYCSMGRWISIVVSQKLGIDFYDDQKLTELVSDDDLTKKEVDDLTKLLMETEESYQKLSDSPLLKKVNAGMTKAVKKAIKKGPCMIHERGTKEDFSDSQEAISVLIYNSSMKDKRKRALLDDKYMDTNEKEIDLENIVKQEDKARSLYKNTISQKDAWGKKESYDLCLNTASISREKCVDILINVLQESSIKKGDFEKIVAEEYGVVE